MRKIFTTLLLCCTTLLWLPSCDNDNGISAVEVLQTQWVCTSADGKPLATDSIFVMYFTPGYNLVISQGQEVSTGEFQWVSNPNFTYELQGEELTIRSNNANVESVLIEATINYLSITNMVMTINNYTVDGISNGNNMQYSLRVANSPIMKDVLPGIWSSPTSTSNNVVNLWEFDMQGNMDYYLYDALAKQYLEQVTSGGMYYTYGSFVVLNYPTTVSSAPSYKVWQVQNLPYGQINWYNTNYVGTTTYETLTSIGQLP